MNVYNVLGYHACLYMLQCCSNNIAVDRRVQHVQCLKEDTYRNCTTRPYVTHVMEL